MPVSCDVPLLPNAVIGNSQDNDGAAQHLSEKGIDLQHVEGSVDGGEQEDGCEGSADAAFATRKKGASDHNHGKGIEIVTAALADPRRPGSQTAGQLQARCRGGGSRNDVRGKDYAVRMNACQPRTDRIAANAVE